MTRYDALAVMNAWVKVPPYEGADVLAGYLTLVNTQDQPLTLVAVRSELFADVEIHEMTMAEGRMRMRELPSLAVPASGQVRLSPGGKHLMLKAPLRELAVGDQVPVTLAFDDGRTQSLILPVRAPVL